MKKLIVLPNINGNYGKLPNGQLYPYTEEQGTVDTWYDIYLVDTKANITKNCWLVDGYNELIHSSEITIDDVSKHYIQGVVIASTDIRTKLPIIPQFVLDKFLENTELDWLVDYGITETGEFVTLCSSDSLTNEWIDVDTTLDLSNTIEVNGKVLIPCNHIADNWVTSNNDNAQYDDLWYQPNSKSKFYPDILGKLLQYCKSEDLENSPGFDDWAEIKIESVK